MIALNSDPQDTMNSVYYKLSQILLEKGEPVRGTTELRNACFTLPNPTFSIASNRDLSLSYLLGELIWYFSGRNDLAFISGYSKKWNDMTDDGKTVNSAYGYRLQKEYGFNQLETVIELLAKDPTSRRAVVNLNVPNPMVGSTRDEPCTIALQFMIRDQYRLTCTAMMRSCDMWFGLPYDVVYFTSLQRYVAKRLGLALGEYTHFASSLHVYDDKKEYLRAIPEKAPQIVLDVVEFLAARADWERRFKIEDLTNRAQIKNDLVKEALARHILIDWSVFE